jgi:hypothetical protein
MARSEDLVVKINLGTVLDEDEGDYSVGVAGYSVDLRGAIVAGAVAQLMQQMDREVKQQIISTVTETIQSQISSHIAEALNEPFQLTTGYGQKLGKETTLRELIMDETRAFLTRPGKESYSNRSSAPSFNGLLQDQVNQSMVKELQPLINKARQDVINAVRDNAANLIASAVSASLKR